MFGGALRGAVAARRPVAGSAGAARRDRRVAALGRIRRPCAFRPVDPRQSFPELEERILERWRERDVFHRSLAQREDAEVWSFYEGPPTANGRPGSHHVLSRVFKDIYPRYQTMRGYRVPRKAGWDCHGLPVELEVEKELGISSKQEIEEYGIAEFNQRCRESVFRVRRGVEPADRADRLLDRPRRPLRHARRRLHRVGLVVAAKALGRRPPLRGPQGRPLLPALRHRALLARGRAGLPGRRGPLHLRAASRCSSRRWRRATSLLVWTTTPWTLSRQRRRRRRRRTSTYVRARIDGRGADRRRAAGRAGARRGRRDRSTASPAATLVGRRYEARPSTTSPTTGRGGHHGPRRPTSSPPRTAPASSTSPPPSARTTTRAAASEIYDRSRPL